MIWLSLGILVILTVLIGALYTYRICFYSSKKRDLDPYGPMNGSQFQEVAHLMHKSTRIMEETACETVTVTASDGTSLFGRYYAVKPGAPVLLAFHGYRSLALRDCAGSFALGLKLSLNVLAPDQRAHGHSQGRTITFGIKERQDVLSWIQYCNRRFGDQTPIILCGLSMGAATVLMAAELDLPENVCGIIADSPYSSPGAIIRKVAKDEGYPERLAYPFLKLGARLYGGFDLDSAAAVSSVKNARVPILLIHGEDDRFVPCDMSREIYANCGENARFFTFPDAGHCLSYVIDYRRYETVCIDFLNSIPALKGKLECV